ncbi:hypothetical protein SLNSH_13750 [Alsobacter soli]|uniref:Uncharacterized protein n=1 Tax=Alsobacter soli TaxID=2109933 RepID=A0A2T1HSC8_9HYPH|nr:hypothetical protein [Alsobacter soli]PSC04555.1 hypothetical protein SLNSH_13750 [Alsobacter soli]
MGFVLRTVIAVGIVYALSPLRDADTSGADLAQQARTAVASHASRAVSAAVELCLKDKAACSLLGLPAAPDGAEERRPAPAQEAAASPPAATGAVQRAAAAGRKAKD